MRVRGRDMSTGSCPLCSFPLWRANVCTRGSTFLTVLNVRHTTVYRYSRPVALGDHRLMLRPRDSHDLRLLRTNLTFSPPASVRWMHDVFGNSVAIASFSEPSTELRIESSLVLETYAAALPPFEIT